MAKLENKEEVSLVLDTEVVEETLVIIPVSQIDKVEKKVVEYSANNSEAVNCLRNEKVIVRHIDKSFMGINNPKHVLSGGMSVNAIRKFGVPKLTNNTYMNVLTNAEKDFLEEALGLEKNALSVHRKVDNFWDDSNGNGVSLVILGKEDNYLTLSNPVDYIKYKILLTNKNRICPSLKEWQDSPKATYEFVLINEGDETKSSKQSMTLLQQCIKEYGKLEDDKDALRLVIETVTGRPTSPNSKLDWLQTKAFELAQSNGKMFLATVTDELLQTKVLIKKAIEEGSILFKGNLLYLKEGNTPMCEFGQEPTLNIAAKYLNSPKHQDVLFALLAKVK